MALTDQPYLPLYVRDWLSNLKLKTCKAESHGIMINIMALMHLSDDYGKLLLNQKYKQTDNQIKNFALQLAKYLPFDSDEIDRGINELLNEKAIKIEGDLLICNRMVKDAEISITRAKVGKEGGLKTSAIKFAKAKSKANTAIENEYVNEINLLKGYCKNYFDEKYITENSLDCFDKLLRIDNYSIEQIKTAISNARSDDFWAKNFLSPAKLRDKDKNKVKYIDRFLAIKSTPKQINNNPKDVNSAWNQ
jgi:hypothetical protein